MIADAQDGLGGLRDAIGRRVAEGWTQRGIAAAVGVHRFTLHRYMTGASRPSLTTARRIAAVLGEPADLLFPRDER